MIDKRELLEILKDRFERNMHRHEGLTWDFTEKLLDSKLLEVISKMEESGGQPDLFIFEDRSLAYVDMVKESPDARRSLCYDREALEKRKSNKPLNSALEFAEEIGIELLDEKTYLFLQSTESFDEKTSSWLKTPDDVRKLGGALFGDRRFGRAFIYHNGADSYYSVRGFRGYIFVGNLK